MGALIRTPTRVIVIIAIVLSIVVSETMPADESEASGLATALLGIGGICIVAVLFGWRWFFRGSAVTSTLLRIYYPEVVVAARAGTYELGPLFVAGWHPDPIGEANYRWWNGVEWTYHTS